MANAKEASLMHWLADQDQLTQEEIMGDMAARIQRVANDRRRAGVKLTNADRLRVLLKAIYASRRIEFDRLGTREDLGDIEQRRIERESRRKGNKSHPGSGRRFLEGNVELLAQLRVAQKLTYRQIQDYIWKNYRKQISLGLIHAVYGEINEINEDQ